MGDFSGLNVALSALYAQRRALDVTGQNIANASTEGYSRQQVQLEAVGGPTIPAMWSRTDGTGQGVRVADVRRLRDQFLEARALTEHATGERLTAARTVLDGVQRLFGEPGDGGLQAQMAQLWSAFDDVANSPNDLATRNQLLERAQTLVTGFHQAATGLTDLWRTTRSQVSTLVQEVNATAGDIAALNGTIRTATQAGLPTNELADRRDVLVDRLARFVGATSRAGDDGSVDVFVGGTALVRGVSTEQLAIGAGSATELSGVPASTVGLVWSRDGYPASVSGQVGGLLDGLNTVLPGYRDALDKVATTLASDVNTIHANGFDLTGAPGGAFFSGSTAADLAVAVTDPAQVAASSAAPGASGPSLDGSNAAALAELGTSTTGADAAYRSLVVDLGVRAQSAARRVDIQQGIVQQVDAARHAVSGVNIDEEAANLVQYQHAYQAAARYLTTVDQMLDTLITRTGVVGR